MSYQVGLDVNASSQAMVLVDRDDNGPCGFREAWLSKYRGTVKPKGFASRAGDRSMKRRGRLTSRHKKRRMRKLYWVIREYLGYTREDILSVPLTSPEDLSDPLDIDTCFH